MTYNINDYNYTIGALSYNIPTCSALKLAKKTHCIFKENTNPEDLDLFTEDLPRWLENWPTYKRDIKQLLI